MQRAKLTHMPQLIAVACDITTLRIDAIVNAANETLLGGGGVDGAIHRAAGPQLVAACKQLPQIRPGVRCETGDAQITPGFELPARHVIHTVGPVWQGGHANEERLLESCYRKVVALAADNGVSELAFPAISCGVYAFPKARACQIAIQTLRSLPLHELGLQKIHLVAFDQAMLQMYEDALRLQ
jgi:O-acetyl-ADP-ribose deacetylase (regulator of RNase III)